MLPFSSQQALARLGVNIQALFLAPSHSPWTNAEIYHVIFCTQFSSDPFPSFLELEIRPPLMEGDGSLFIPSLQMFSIRKTEICIKVYKLQY